MAAPVYSGDPADAVRLVALDGLTALYHRPSGTTHLLAPPAPQILAVLADKPGSADEILARMALRFDVQGDREALLARLAELEEAGLVCRSPAEIRVQTDAEAGPRLSPGNKDAGRAAA